MGLGGRTRALNNFFLLYQRGPTTHQEQLYALQRVPYPYPEAYFCSKSWSSSQLLVDTNLALFDSHYKIVSR